VEVSGIVAMIVPCQLGPPALPFHDNPE
jgi:hypothetical protein